MPKKKKEELNPHDSIFKDLIEEFFKEFMEMFWPDKAKLIDFDTVHFLQQEVYTDRTPGQGKERRLDIVAEVKINNEAKHILIHVEHQSTKESNFPQRMFNYFCHLWLVHQKPIFPIALFSDDAKWEKLIPKYFEMRTLDKRVLRFDYELIKLKNLNWKKYLKSENPLAITLMSKMGYKKEERPRVKAEITRLFVTGILRDHPKSIILKNFMNKYLELNQKENIIFKDTLINEFEVTEEEQKMIWAKEYQKVYDKGYDKAKIEFASKLLEEGLDWSFIKKTTGLSKTRYNQLIKTVKVPNRN